MEEVEDKLATEKSGEPSSGQSTPLADSTESPLENRALKMRSGEQQKTDQGWFSGGNISSNPNPREAAGLHSRQM